MVKCLEIAGCLVGVDGLITVIGRGYLEILCSCFHCISVPRQIAKARTSWSKKVPEKNISSLVFDNSMKIYLYSCCLKYHQCQPTFMHVINI